MKLYYSPGACSLATHIMLTEYGFEFDLERVDLSTKQTESGADFTAINPKGYVPALQLDGGEVLTEAAVTLQYVSDLKRSSESNPLSRYRRMELLNFISTEFHKAFGALFNPNISASHRDYQLELIGKRCQLLSDTLIKDKNFLLNDEFSAADAYLFVVLSWSNILNVDIGKWPVITDYLARIAQRPAVTKAMIAEGLIEAT